MAKRATIPFDTLVIEPNSGTPLTRQLYNLLRHHITGGRIPIGTRLPSTRALSQQLGIGRNTVLAAYDQLLAEGYVKSETGSGTWVAFSPAIPSSRPASILAQPKLSRRGEILAREPQMPRSPKTLNFQPGFPETITFPYSTWSRLLSQNARQRGGDMVGYYDYAGHQRLRRAIATYIGVARGVDCDPEQVIVVTGAQAALDLVSRVVLDEGDQVWIEDPGYLGAHSALLGGGARLSALRVDRNGWNLDDPGLPPPRAIYVTPACQWPLGLTMGVNERMRLLALAEIHNAWVIEDDYDGEYRFRGRPVPALYGLDRSSRVIYIGTFGKILFSSLRLGFLVVPRGLSDSFGRAISVTGQFAPLLLQSTLADFMQEGHFAAHLRRMRRLYARRQAMLIDLCERHLGSWVSITANDAGMQLLANLLPPWDDRLITSAARLHGVDVQPVSMNYRYQTPEHGLLLGFAALDEKNMHAAIAGLQATFRDLDAGAPKSGSSK